MKEKINNLLKKEYLIMLYVEKKKIFWLRKHYRFLRKRDMLKDKVLLGPNNIGLQEGFNYITHPFTSKLKQTNTMAKTGKEAISEIAEHYKVVKESAKVHAKNIAVLNKMVNQFPKKEKELYAEKLAKYTVE